MALILRVCGPNGESHGGFRWPLVVGTYTTEERLFGKAALAVKSTPESDVDDPMPKVGACPDCVRAEGA